MLVGRGERLLFMDADGATHVSDVEKLEAAVCSALHLWISRQFGTLHSNRRSKAAWMQCKACRKAAKDY